LNCIVDGSLRFSQRDERCARSITVRLGFVHDRWMGSHDRPPVMHAAVQRPQAWERFARQNPRWPGRDSSTCEPGYRRFVMYVSRRGCASTRDDVEGKVRHPLAGPHFTAT
jgi:hypothetical protein